ncbi:MAG: hypothetical protein L0Z50_03265 [Verrucomicrobiales bacterium]|nr:hypothetical protein [Verrucomicrobiales bacterium]
MQFVWFLTFWHWSKESFRTGRLLRPSLHGIGSHWDEWFRHEAPVYWLAFASLGVRNART